MSGNKYHICAVCGDKAIGFNFHAISCESCKAFFRRNALKNKFKCFLGGDCKIDAISRTSCRKCRLDKCFTVGMKTDLILSEQQKQLRKNLIEENRNKRRNNIKNKRKKVCDSVGSESTNSDTNSNSIVFLSNNNINISDDKSEGVLENDICNTTTDINENSQNHCQEIHINPTKVIESIQESPEFETNKSPVILEVQCFNREAIDTEILEFPNYILDLNPHNTPETIFQKTLNSQLPILPIHRPITDYRNNFNELEGNKLTELLNSIQLMSEPIAKNTLIARDSAELVRAIHHKCEYEIKKFVKMTKTISAFKSLIESDQIVLIKFSFFEGNNKSVLMKLEFIRNEKLRSHHINYLRNMGSEWDSDKTIIDLITAVLLFNPNRPNLIHKEMIKYQQNIYIYLLQRYLQLKYCSETESKAKFSRLMNTLVDVYILSERISHVHLNSCEKLNIKECVPLIKEICNRYAI